MFALKLQLVILVLELASYLVMGYENASNLMVVMELLKVPVG